MEYKINYILSFYVSKYLFKVQRETRRLDLVLLSFLSTLGFIVLQPHQENINSSHPLDFRKLCQNKI